MNKPQQPSNPTTPLIQINFLDVFTLIKASIVHEMAKAEKILRNPHTGLPSDIEKVSAQGAYTLADSLYKILTLKLQEAQIGAFSIREEINKLMKNIRELDEFSLIKMQVQAPSVSGQAKQTPPMPPRAPEVNASALGAPAEKVQ